MATTTTTATPAAPLARARPPVPKFREPVFLVDMAAFKPPDELRIDVEACSDACWSWKHPDGKPVSAETHEFVKTVFLKSGIAKNGSYLPANLHPLHAKGEPRGGQAESFAEARLVMGGVVTDLLERNGLKPTDIDILVTGSSIFCPTPSLGSMLINQLKMREDVQAFHLGGMGCGNGVIGLTLMRSLLSSFPGARAVFVTAEICSSAFYRGENKHCLVSNALFRMGGAACLMTSGNAQRRFAKYELLDAERVNQAARDESFNSMFVGPDETGLDGIFLFKHLPTEAGRALTSALTKVTPRILDWPQFLSAAVTTLKRKYYGKDKVPRFVPDYTKCVDHFLLHAGGYGVLKGIQQGMRLPAEKMMPSFANLSRFGNTSSATTWYAWTYLESTTGVKKGDRLLQAGVGGGMKACVVIWRAVRDVRDPHRAWAHLGGVPCTEADLPRPITVTGTLTGLDEDGRPAAAAKGKGDSGRGEGATAGEKAPAAAEPAVASTTAAQRPESPKTPGRVVT